MEWGARCVVWHGHRPMVERSGRSAYGLYYRHAGITVKWRNAFSACAVGVLCVSRCAGWHKIVVLRLVKRTIADQESTVMGCRMPCDKGSVAVYVSFRMLSVYEIFLQR